MRKTRDRIRHAILFELIGLMIVIPGGGALFGVDMTHFGVVAVVSTTVAMGWNYAYNLLFDHAMLRLYGDTRKRVPSRIVHAVLFEAGLLALLVPFIAIYLGLSLWDAFVMDVALAAFYVVYAFVFNWAYDVIFPVPPAETGSA